jgi:hypothetical protein
MIVWGESIVLAPFHEGMNLFLLPIRTAIWCVPPRWHGPVIESYMIRRDCNECMSSNIVMSILYLYAYLWNRSGVGVVCSFNVFYL